jgi:serine/threonine-protein kinase ULK/ATG1
MSDFDFESNEDQLKKFKIECDIKASTRVKVADLGFSKQLDESTDLAATQCGTVLYMAPEVLDGCIYNYKVDVWSLGCIFYEMVVGKPPFTGYNK